MVMKFKNGHNIVSRDTYRESRDVAEGTPADFETEVSSVARVFKLKIISVGDRVGLFLYVVLSKNLYFKAKTCASDELLKNKWKNEI
jgi:hypothetical protein